jgi:hypothetical protein
MKEVGTDGSEFGIKNAADGWHVVEFGEGIDFMKEKGKDTPWQDADGNKAYVFPLKVKDTDDPDDGATIGLSIFTKGGGNQMASVLAAVGLWDSLTKAFPDPNVSVFDKQIMDSVKIKLPGMQCMVESKLDKNNFSRVHKIASFAKYKEIIAAEKAAGVAKPQSNQGAPTSNSEPAAAKVPW